MASLTPGPHTHEQWLGLVQPVGLVVAPAVLSALQLFPNQSPPYLSARQRQLEGLLEEVEGPGGQPLSVVPSFALLATELLDWGEADLVAARALESVPEVVLAEYGETLCPTHGVPKFEGEGLQALVLDLTQWRNAHGKPDPQWGRDFDAKWNPTGHGWDATPQQRFERLLKETEIPIGLLFNGSQLRLVHAPRGESSGWLTMPLEPMAEVAGRPMLGALELLLGVDRLFGGNPEQRLPAVLAASRKNQNEVSTRLAEQVLEALWELLLGFDEAERIAREASGTVLGQLPNSEEGQKHLYGGMITVLLRLVFLLYAEDEALMPADSLYGQHYSVSALADRLRQERFEHQGAMADRRGAWASLLSLFRLVYDGGGADPAYLPARHGELFDPNTYPFLEGRKAGSSYKDDILTNLPAISDDVVEKVLTRLLWLADESKVAQRLNYRSLDVEQIGSVYEGIMGFMVEKATGLSVGITHRPPRQKITITVVVNASDLLAQPASKRDQWLKAATGVDLKLGDKVKKGIKVSSTVEDLCEALNKRLSKHTPRGGFQGGSLILQPTAERRRSGSHYTPRSLTEPIVAEAFRPWLERCNYKPTAEQVLALKVCDPAMGSGAFLVAVCRFLAGWLVQAWEDPDGPGFPPEFRAEWDKDLYARRLIAQRCLYGVDKNPFAVNLAKLSLWLVTLSKELPFTFVDHALKCGDSLVGEERKKIEAELKAATKQREIWEGRLQELRLRERKDYELFHADSRNDADDERKREVLRELQRDVALLRTTGDLIVAAFFNGSNPKDREELHKIYLTETVAAATASDLEAVMEEPLKRLRVGEKGIRPLHWQIEFPDVFNRDQPGFDVFVGNPPFAGKNTIAKGSPDGILDWFKHLHPESHGNSDLVAHFFRRCFQLLRACGSMGLIATKTIAQGDTRSTGLRWICMNGGIIYAARKRYKWPGVAAVVVSVVHLFKAGYAGEKFLDKRAVPQITAFLLEKGGHEDPKPLQANVGKSFVGSYVLGMGFTFDDSGEAEDDMPGTPSPISTMKQLIADNPNNADVIFPFMGGKEVNESPTHAHCRYVINFGDRSEEECRRKWPELISIVERKVKGTRGSHSTAPWWQFERLRGELYEAAKGCQQVLVTSAAAVSYHMVNSVTAERVFSHKLIVFPEGTSFHHMVMQSLFHEEWSRAFGATQGSADALTYNPTDVYLTFPFPEKGEDACDICKTYSEERASLLRQMNLGPTKAYGALHSPLTSRNEIAAFRALHDQANQAIAQCYDWHDIDLASGFGLDKLDFDDDLVLPPELQDRIDSGELFFASAPDATSFDSALRAVTGSKSKLSWRYRWPDAVRDDVLARLLALNAERYQEEVDQGLHGGGRGRGGGGSSGGSGTGRRRGQPPKTLPTGSDQIGLSL